MWRNASCKVLVVDDDEGLLQAMRKQSTDIIRVETAKDSSTARALARCTYFDVALVDRLLGYECGIDLLYRLRRLQSHMLIAMVTGHLEPEHALEAAHAGADDVVEKPIRLSQAIEHLVQRNAQRVARCHFATRDHADWQHIQHVLAACGGNKKRASEILRISRSTLKQKLHQGPPADYGTE